MADDTITVDNVSKELLKNLFDAAFMDSSFDKDGDLRVDERVRCWIYVYPDMRKIKLAAYFGFKPGTSEIEALRCVNNINKERLCP